MPQVQTELPAANGAEVEARSPHAFCALTLGSMGVVFSDIGTSPFMPSVSPLMQRLNQTAFSHARSCSAYGRSFLWALILVVTCKYVLILLRAHNKGEGGTPRSWR